MLEPSFSPKWLSVAVLKEPLIRGGAVSKGALILNHVDNVVQLLPELRKLFFIVERRGWHGPAHSKVADIKFVEDITTLEWTRQRFPRAVILPLSNADFVDTSSFMPLGTEPEYDVIQIACWSRRKRIDLLIRAAANLPHLSFLQLGSFDGGGTPEELDYRDACLRLAERAGARITFPYGHCDANNALPWGKREINSWINKARLGVLTASMEGHNRFKMECMAADRAVLVARDAGATTQKHINAKTGALFEPTSDGLAEAIGGALTRPAQFTPRRYLLHHSGRMLSLPRLKAALKDICAREGAHYHFDDIDWDGRNERFIWGEAGLAVLKSIVDLHRWALVR